MFQELVYFRAYSTRKTKKIKKVAPNPHDYVLPTLKPKPMNNY